MSKTGRFNPRRGTRGTPRSERRLLAECVRRDGDEQGRAQTEPFESLHRHQHEPDVSEFIATSKVLKRSTHMREVGRGHR